LHGGRPGTASARDTVLRGLPRPEPGSTELRLDELLHDDARIGLCAGNRLARCVFHESHESGLGTARGCVRIRRGYAQDVAWAEGPGTYQEIASLGALASCCERQQSGEREESDQDAGISV
jgi:hypothetical protein